MRSPGYRNAEFNWHSYYHCDVLFNELDFGPNLTYSSFAFTPSKLRTNFTKIPGLPGMLDRSQLPNGFPVPERMSATLELFVRDARAWGMPGPPDGMSPEARFLAQLNAGPVKLEFINSNQFYLMAYATVSRYTRFGLGFNITLRLDCEPYWWENAPGIFEWSLHGVGANLFDGASAAISEDPGCSCAWESAPLDVSRKYFVLHAPPNQGATVTITGLNASHHYTFSWRNIFGMGRIYFLTSFGGDLTDITGATSLSLRLISLSAKDLAVGFADIKLTDNASGTERGSIITLDNPVEELTCWASAACRLVVAGQSYDIQPGDSTLFGLQMAPRTATPAAVIAEDDCYGYLSWKRGAKSCTL